LKWWCEHSDQQSKGSIILHYKLCHQTECGTHLCFWLPHFQPQWQPQEIFGVVCSYCECNLAIINSCAIKTHSHLHQFQGTRSHQWLPCGHRSDCGDPEQQQRLETPGYSST
jgi:hypothetical protein